jgi:hypothetical protein
LPLREHPQRRPAVGHVRELLEVAIDQVGAEVVERQAQLGELGRVEVFASMKPSPIAQIPRSWTLELPLSSQPVMMPVVIVGLVEERSEDVAVQIARQINMSV